MKISLRLKWSPGPGGLFAFRLQGVESRSTLMVPLTLIGLLSWTVQNAIAPLGTCPTPIQFAAFRSIAASQLLAQA